MRNDELRSTGYTGLFAPGIATAMFAASVWHLYSDSPATWRGGGPISSATIFVGGILLLVLPIWLSRKDRALLPIALKPKTYATLKKWVAGFSLLTMSSAVFIAAYAQHQMMADPMR